MDSVDLSGSGPLYRRLADQIRAAARRGEVGVGSRLPSERDLARSLGLSRTTVIAAYRVLREEGLLESARGSGTRVAVSARSIGPAVPVSEMPAAKLPGERFDGLIDCSGSVMPACLDGLPEETLNVTAGDLRALAAGFDYEPLGLPSLRAAIAARYTSLGLTTTADEILVTSGAQQAIDLLFTLFGRDRGTILTENPTYAGALDSARAVGATVIGLPVDDEGLKVRALRETLDRSPARLIYLMTACQNPTGTMMSSARWHAIARLAEATGTAIVDDTTLADLAFDGRPAVSLTASSGGATVITVGSLSKLFWAGMRMGWIRAPEYLITRLARLKVVADLGSSHISQLLAARVLPATDETRAYRRRQLTERLDILSGLLRTHLPTWSWTHPQGGPFLWVRLPHGNAEDFSQLAARHGVRVLSGTKTSHDDAFSNHLRISYVAEPPDLRLAAERLRRAWAELESGDNGQAALDFAV
ncbi:PLP-dependent aminotransferase family protein [Actinomadura sp. HBU206391]|uniref:aminotransferase-like domain-containing protein n=1 Tax=Actinomadura sp. HBU206391 TaxID=2731692 RepID=UPI0016509489|nr:PLP-dependent aminotransferase family protein [Actinomadura sp. HBU206391]MBC6459395.1 PLP-dependent aminotransferase family protein [Actinomadura sp. HBU206391]